MCANCFYRIPLIPFSLCGRHYRWYHSANIKPHVHEQVYVKRKDYHSLNKQICGNGDLMIMDVVAKWPGSVNDSRILRNSTLHDKFTEQVLPNLPNGIILGDAGYPLLEWLLVPYVENPGLTQAEYRYNRAHRSARSVIEIIIGILKRRWACLKKLRFNPEKCWLLLYAVFCTISADIFH